MFSSALKSFTSNISSNYTLLPSPSSTSGPWKIFDATKKSTGKPASVFVFDRKSLDPHGGGSFGGKMNAASLKRAHDEVLERLKKEASSLARLRHPSILELVEPVEETRNGGLMFATEPVTASLAVMLQEKDDQEKAGGVGGRGSRYVVEEADGTKKRRELEIDELEIQKGLLQVGKGLEFLHESAGLVHGNLTPDAIFVNAKSDWKISGLGFCSPPENSSKPTSVSPIALSEVLNYDPRLPRTVQLNLDYTSPDFVLDNNVTSAADMFSLGLLIIALYNSPHRSPLETNGNLSTYKRVFSVPSAIPNQSNNFQSSTPLPKDVLSGLLPRMITRRPAQRLSAREFQQAQYFDNILVSTIRFLDSLPAKTPNEKSQFMRGLPRILKQFPRSVLEKKVLPALLEEMKDRELLSLILQNVFQIITALPFGKRAFTEKVIPRLREVFLAPTNAKIPHAERDSSREAGLMILLENMKIIADNTGGKEFKDDILPIVHLALESPTHSLVDAALRYLPVILPVLDFSTIKNELFPVVANVFAKTSSMGIKIRGLQALQTLCGGSPSGDATTEDDFDGISVTKRAKLKPSTSQILDKYTIQEKVVPLLKGIKTKEPAVMMAVLDVFKEVGKIADSDFLAMDVLPILWSFSLGPLLNLAQFQAFMTLIKTLSTRIEQEQTRKLQELSASNAAATTTSNDFMSFGGVGRPNGINSSNGDEGDFENLVLGRNRPATSTNALEDWASSSTTLPTTTTRPAQPRSKSEHNPAPAPSFSWSTPSPHPGTLVPTTAPASRAITPDTTLSAFAPLTPSAPSANPYAPPTTSISASTFSQPLQPSRPNPPGMRVLAPTQPSATPSFPPAQGSSIDWSAATAASQPAFSSAGIWSSQQQPALAIPSQARPQGPPATSPYQGFGIAPPPLLPPPPGGQGRQSQMSGRGLGRGMGASGVGGGAGGGGTGAAAGGMAGGKQGLDKYESLL
ncbi:SCY1 protein kinase [Coniosporium apollinis CBS 100218]|uniref:SCY1 protein kinase n=1 Tax=Coniosporium apollinis (strain CBS 100218) TaxID=1168221 RepID=R7YH16_CONA1|nr:SCY1 protein kinase [Coniosporium apollinis CBS 100218]EON61195.1 SCY1 protein kinase [Coniosporium apollinis CBS 100218]